MAGNFTRAFQAKGGTFAAGVALAALRELNGAANGYGLSGAMKSAHAATGAFFVVGHEIGAEIPTLGIVTPGAAERAAFEKNCRTYAGAVMNRKFLQGKHEWPAHASGSFV